MSSKTSERVIAAERASKTSSPDQASKWMSGASKWARDKQVAEYLRQGAHENENWSARMKKIEVHINNNFFVSG